LQRPATIRLFDAAFWLGTDPARSVGSLRGLKAITKGHEKEIETAFVADQDKTDLSKWFYNGTLTKRATSAIGSAIASSNPITNTPLTSAAPCARSWL
jgi:hypothetical protein